jgi:hypothetical protein
MRTPKVLVLLAELLKKPYFTSRKVREKGVHPSALSHYAETGRLKRGIYQSGGYQNPLAFQWEDLIAAVYSVRRG